MEEAVIDTSVLASFSGISRIDLIFGVFPNIYIVAAVYREIVTDGEGWSAVTEAQSAIRGGRFRLVEATGFSLGPGMGDLGVGEREVIAWALCRRIPALIDEAPARRVAKRVGVVEVVGSLGILARAKSLKMVEEIAPLVLQMKRNGIYFGDDLVDRFLEAVGEK